MSQSSMLAAARRAKALVNNPFTIVDLETTGFDGYRERIVQIAVVNEDGETLMDSLVNPGVPIPNSHIHGITNDMVEDAPSFADLHPTLTRALNGMDVLAYNWSFDGSFILGNCKQHKLALPEWTHADCIMELFARFYGEWNSRYKSYRWQELATAAAHFDLSFEGQAHSALADAKMALAVLKKMAEKAD